MMFHVLVSHSCCCILSIVQLKVGSLGSNSYIPAGLSKAEYEKIRANDLKKKEENYKKNASKAGKFTNFTDCKFSRLYGGDANLFVTKVLSHVFSFLHFRVQEAWN